MPSVNKLVNDLIDDAHKGSLAKMVAAIVPSCILLWEAIDEEFSDKAAFAKQTVDIAEALLKEISKRKYPDTEDQ